MRRSVLTLSCALLAAAAALAAACSTPSSSTGNASRGEPGAPGSSPASGDDRAATIPIVVFSPPGQARAAVTVEIVRTPREIQRGLMFREHLPQDHGMLFLMGEERVHSFWMRNTLIPLDMIFIGKDMTVAGVVANTEPLTETRRQVDEPSLYVLEVNAGWAKANQVGPGTPVRFQNVE